ncbi:hypothetical protein LY76DRAFT_213970 [Colletotrichum caudatum]|nr:hypothetical protein LY76DRAFT_213970 [Colletotrichum caudatum]
MCDMRAALADTRMRGRALPFVIRTAPQDLSRAPSFLCLQSLLLGSPRTWCCPWAHPLLSGILHVRHCIPASADRLAVHPKWLSRRTSSARLDDPINDEWPHRLQLPQPSRHFVAC